MPKKKLAAQKLGAPLRVRLPPDEEAYFRAQAALHRMPISGYLTKLLIQGATAESAAEIGDRMQQMIDTLNSKAQTGDSASMYEHIALSAFTSEALLTAILQKQDVSTLYDAQDAARAKLNKIREG
jgi:hypothetical protein